MVGAYLQVQYIGGNPDGKLTDNIVHGSGRVWKGRLSSIRVPEAEVAKYTLRHPDEFRLLHPLFLLSPYAEALSADDQLHALHTMVGSLERHAAEELLVTLQGRLKDLEGFSGKADMTSADRVRFNERQKAIADTIKAMDPDDATHFTDQGRPRVAVVKELCGLEDVSGAEIAEIHRQMKLVEAAA